MRRIETGRLLLGSINYHQSFRRHEGKQPIDGSQVAMVVVDELAMLPGPLVDKLLVLYACGVHDYQKEVFDPRQVLAMIRFNDPYRPEAIIGRENGNADGSFCYVSPNDKRDLLEGLCQQIESFDPLEAANVSELDQVREELVRRGVDERFLLTVSDKALLVYFLANEAQFLLKLIHPFWERNGRTSEELLHLICAMNGIDKLVFWEDLSQRYNVATRERMDLIDGFTMALLPSIAERMGLRGENEDFQSVDDLYQMWFKQKDRMRDFRHLNWLRKKPPIKYLQSRAVFFGEKELMEEYFTALRLLVEERIGFLESDRFQQLLQDEVALTLVMNQLSNGRRVGHFPGLNRF